jgi:hypothetical protein
MAYRRLLFIGRNEDRPSWDLRSRFAFAACDSNGDGMLTQEELDRAPDCDI